MRTVTNVIYAKDVIYACRKHVINGEKRHLCGQPPSVDHDATFGRTRRMHGINVIYGETSSMVGPAPV